MDNHKGFMLYNRELPSLRSPRERINDFNTHEKGFGIARTLTQANRCMGCGIPFCSSACPIGNPIPQFNYLVKKEQWLEALKLLHATNNFPEFTGLVCPAPCESSCVLGLIDDSVTIKHLEWEIIQKGFTNGWIHPQVPEQRTGKSVAIIGSGPAGLACAQQLNRAGHKVEVFEKSVQAGGLLRYGIPEYKLPKYIVDRRLSLLEEEGISFHLGCEIGKDKTFTQLQEEFNAVVLAIGSEVPRDLKVEGRNGLGVYNAMDFLSRQHLPGKAQLDVKNKNVVVIGGGDTGSDCIGTALRLGAKSVLNFELRPKPPEERSEENPWPQYKQTYKVSSSMEENFANGGKTLYNTTTKSFILDKNNHCIGIEAMDVEWSSNSREFKEIDGSQKRYDCDLVFLALGYIKPDLSGLLAGNGLAFEANGQCKTDESKMTNLPGVFASGDCRRGQSLIVWAIAEGRDTAAKVDTWLMNQPSLLPECSTEQVAF